MQLLWNNYQMSDPAQPPHPPIPPPTPIGNFDHFLQKFLGDLGCFKGDFRAMVKIKMTRETPEVRSDNWKTAAAATQLQQQQQ